MRPGSHVSDLARLQPGERMYRETTLERYANDMRAMSVPRTRRPPELAGREFEARLFTAVGTRAGDVRYLICVERTT